VSRTVAPFGSWVSALSTEDAAAGSVRFDGVSLSEVAEGGVRVRWLETRPDEAGRGVVCEWVGSVRSGGSAVDLLPAGVSARSLVNEYGGGAWWDGPGDTVLAVDARSQDVVEIEAGVEPVVVVAGAGVRHAAGVLTPDGRWLVAEREHHPAPADGFHHDLVAVRLDGGASTPIELVRGPGFVAAPTVSPDGAHLAWLSWDHPDMPWDAAALWAGDLVERSGALAVERTRRVAGGADAGLNRAVSVCLPRWSADSLLWWCDDRDDFWHLRRSARPGLPEAGSGDSAPLVWDRAEEVGEPRWVAGGRRYGWTGDGRVVAASTAGGQTSAWVAEPGHVPEPVPGPQFTSVERLDVDGQHVALIAGTATQPTTVWLVDLSSGESLDLRNVSAPIGADDSSRPEPISFPTSDGEVAHGLFFPPASATHAGPQDALPPLVVRIHGGPTAAARAEWSPSVQFWTTRGIAVVEVDYRGSTGYGRRYRDLLRGRWGVADVEDCRAAARWLADHGRVDPASCVIRGGSAGGFTALGALVADGTERRAAGPGVFAAACSLYGVTDLARLAADTHEFESRYLDGLVGPWPEGAATYNERSPVTQVDLIGSPVLILQGADDPVVPLSQAEFLRDALAERGVPHAMLVFAGEGHGFRQSTNIVRALETELAFYGEVLGFVPAGGRAAVLARSTAVAPERPET
jgi:dipeptidyl aminopeptidase/acylaminoacyl peptidase